MTTIDEKITAHNADTAAHATLRSVIGNLGDLTTSDQTDIVHAINETKSDVDALISAIDGVLNQATPIPGVAAKMEALQDAIDAIQTAIEDKGITISDTTKLSDYDGLVALIEKTPDFNVHFHESEAPVDTTKLWLKKTMQPVKIIVQNQSTFDLWQSLAKMTGTTNYTSTYGYACHYNGKVYIKSAAADATDNYFAAYNIAADAWETLTPLNNYISYDLLVLDGTLYSMSSAVTSEGVVVSIWTYNIESDEWTLKKRFVRRNYPSIRACVLNGIIYMLYEFGGGIWHLHSYNPATDKVSPDLNLAITKASDSDIVLTAGKNKLYCTTGTSVYEYNPADNTNRLAGSIVTSIGLMMQHATVYAKGKIYYAMHSGTAIQTFDIETETAGSIAQANNGYIAAFDGDRHLYLFGYWVYGSAETGIASSYNIDRESLETGEVAIITGRKTGGIPIKLLFSTKMELIVPIQTAFYGVSGSAPAEIPCAIYDGNNWVNL